jgi:hypothetical protein
LYAQERTLFDFQEDITLYDLTNTYDVELCCHSSQREKERTRHRRAVYQTLRGAA